MAKKIPQPAKVRIWLYTHSSGTKFWTQVLVYDKNGLPFAVIRRWGKRGTVGRFMTKHDMPSAFDGASHVRVAEDKRHNGGYEGDVLDYKLDPDTDPLAQLHELLKKRKNGILLNQASHFMAAVWPETRSIPGATAEIVHEVTPEPPIEDKYKGVTWGAWA